MAKFRVLIDTDNEAFLEPGDVELVRCLREIADSVESGCSDALVRDRNGNAVGDFGWVA